MEPDPSHKHGGRIVIDFYDPGSGPMYPVVSFDPVGRIVPNTIDQHLGTIYREIQTAQALTRNNREVPAPRRLRGNRHAA